MSSPVGLPASPPLAGIRVLEVGNYIAGPYCGMQLADLGAEVIKVEIPGSGDQVRTSGPFLEGESSTFIRLNRNKRSLAVDLKDATGNSIFRRLADGADVVVENLRPGTMADLGLDYATLAATNPRLVYVAISGWGQTGPYSQLAGLDIMAQAMSGLMSITGEPGGDPVKSGVPICDLVCGLYGALATLAALAARQRDGVGDLIDVSLFEAGVSLAVWEAGKYFATGEVPRALGSAHQSAAPYQAIRAADGYFTVGATSPRTWHGFCEALLKPEWEFDERFDTGAKRHADRAALIAEIEAITVSRPIAYWVGRLQEAGVPCAEIQAYDRVFNDPQLLARNFFWDAPHPRLAPVRQIGSPLRLNRTPVLRSAAGPSLGADTLALLQELGFTEPSIRELAERGAIGIVPAEKQD